MLSLNRTFDQEACDEESAGKKMTLIALLGYGESVDDASQLRYYHIDDDLG